MKVIELKREMDALFVQVEARFAQVDARFAQVDARFAEVIAKLEARITEEGETTRRHFDIVAESIRADVRSAVAATAVAHQRLDVNDSEHVTFTGVLDDHELRLKSLDHY